MANESVTLSAEAIPFIRRMLIVGLHAYGECDRLRQESQAAETMGAKIATESRPTMLTGDFETANFAEALSWLDCARVEGAED